MCHAEKVPVQAMGRPVSSVYYLPMHGILKEASSTTKLRIVFDASAKSISGNSLNDILLSGLSLYPLLPTIVNRFRLHKIGMSGDISKMFREVCLHPEDFDLHRFLYQEDSGEIIDCCMKRLTFGVTTSPHLASQVLRQLASDYSDEFPTAAALIEQAFYVDDCLTGADTLREECHIREELNQLFDKAKMTLHKWRTSSTELLVSIPDELRETSALNITPSPGEHGKALGIHWDTDKDCLYVATPDLSSAQPASKRSVSSIIAKTFDVLGWYSLAILPAKLLLQELWRMKVTWDDPLPEALQQRWQLWLNEIPNISTQTRWQVKQSSSLQIFAWLLRCLI